MSFTFPNSPTAGQEVNGYIWDGQKWVKRQPGDATISPTPPLDAHPGQLWWESDTGDLYIYYHDGTSAQWVGVDTSGSSSDALHVLKSGDTMTGRLDVFDAGPESVSGVIGSLINVAEGSSVTPITANNAPTFSASRHENITFDGTSDGSLGPAILGSIRGYGSQQSVAITGVARGDGPGDIVGLYGSAGQNGTNTNLHVAYGGFFTSASHVANSGAGAFGIEVAVTNDSGADVPYSGNSPWPRMTGVHVAPMYGQLNSVGLWFGNHDGLGAKFDVGIAMTPGTVKTTSFQDDTNSVNVLKATGSHTNGIDLSAASFTGAAFKSPGFTITKDGTAQPAVDSAVAVSVDTTTGPGIVVANGGNTAICIGFGLVVLHEVANNGEVSLWLVTGATASLVAQTGSFYVASTTTPGAGKASMAWNGAAMAIYNNRGGSSTFFIGQYRT